MGARQKLNQLHLLAIGIVSAVAGLLFSSLDAALMLGVLMAAALTAGGAIRLFPTAAQPARRPRRRRPR